MLLCVRSIEAAVSAEFGFRLRVVDCVDGFARTQVALRLALSHADDRPLSDRALIAALGDRIFELCRLHYDDDERCYVADVVVSIDWREA